MLATVLGRWLYWRTLAGFCCYFVATRVILAFIPDGHRLITGIEVEEVQFLPRLDLALLIPIAAVAIAERGLSRALFFLRLTVSCLSMLAIVIFQLYLVALRIRGEVILFSRGHVVSYLGLTVEILLLLAIVGGAVETSLWFHRRSCPARGVASARGKAETTADVEKSTHR